NPLSRTATQVSTVCSQVWPGRKLTNTRVPGARSARHAGSSPTCRQVISIDAALASAAIACATLAELGALLGEAMPRDDIRLVLEPQPTVLLQHFAGVVEIASVGHHRLQPLVLDLRDIDGGVPRGEQCRRADRGADLQRQGVHLVAEIRALIGIGVEI